MTRTKSEIIRKLYASGWSPRKGKKHSEETKEKIRQTKIKQGIVPPTAFKKGQPSWNKGLKLSYSYGAVHKRIAKDRGKPDTCEVCGKTGLKPKQINWANTNHKYNEDVYEDWVRMCCKCHRQHDYLNNR